MPVRSISRRLILALSATLGLAFGGLSCGGTQTFAPLGGGTATGETYEALVDDALSRVGTEAISFGATEAMARRKHETVWLDLPDKIKDVPAELQTKDLLGDAEIKAALMGTDEGAAVKVLWAKGVRMLVLHTDVAGNLDRTGAVLSRLYNHDHLEAFELFRVGDGLLYYELREAPLQFPPQLARASLIYLRGRLKGAPPVAFPDVKSETNGWTLAATLRSQGRPLAVGFATNKTLQGALEELVGDLEAKHRRWTEGRGFPPLNVHMDDVQIEIHRVVERAYIEPRKDEQFLEDYWEMGIDGAYMMTADQKERAFLPGSESYTQAIRQADSFLQIAAKEGRMSERRPWRDTAAWLESVRTLHYMEDNENDALVFLYRGQPAVPLSAVTLASAREGIVHMGDWYLNNLAPNGQVIYKMWPAENRYSSEYNLVRHTLATWNMYQAWKMAPERTEFLEGAKMALDYTNTWLVRQDGKAWYTYNNNQKLGTVVVNLMGMIDLAHATDDHSYDELMEEMGTFVMAMQLPNGKFEGYRVPEGHSYHGQTNDIVPGEAALALIMLADYFDDDKWISGLDRYWEYYKPWWRERVAKGDTNRPWPHKTYSSETRLELVQFGPWTVMAANAYHRRTGDADVADFGLEIARWMIETYEYTTPKAPFPDYIGGYYKLPGELPAMQAFCYAEGTAAAYDLALRASPEEANFFGEATRETVRFGLQMQFNDFNTYAFTRPMQVDGGIRYAMNETKVRIDYVHHALSAMYQWHEAAKNDPNLDPSIKNGPMLKSQQLRLTKLALEKAEREAELAAAAEAGETPPRHRLDGPSRMPYLVPVRPVTAPREGVTALAVTEPWPAER